MINLLIRFSTWRGLDSWSWCRGAALVMPLVLASNLPAQPMPIDRSTHQHPATAPASQALADQVQDLKAKIAQLEGALRHGNPTAGMGQATAASGGNGMTGTQPGAMTGMAGMGGGPAVGANPMGGMMQEMGAMMQMMGGMMGGMKPGGAELAGMKQGGAGMPGMKMDASEMGGMKAGGSSGGMSGMGGPEKMGGMMGMMGMPPGGGMGGAGPMTAALPGFPGASHLYHIGGTGFFLDHAEHISLSIQQQAALNAAKEKAMLAKAVTQRKIDTGEQELWALTAVDQPDVAQIEAKLREVEKVRGDERLDFIRAVGEAAKILTDGQRQSLLGFQPPQPAPAMPGAMPPAAPAGGMGGHM